MSEKCRVQACLLVCEEKALVSEEERVKDVENETCDVLCVFGWMSLVQEKNF